MRGSWPGRVCQRGPGRSLAPGSPGRSAPPPSSGLRERSPGPIVPPRSRNRRVAGAKSRLGNGFVPRVLPPRPHPWRGAPGDTRNASFGCKRTRCGCRVLLKPRPRFMADEDDVHKCGRCQAEFTSLEEFVQHKLQKVCQRAPEALAAASAALLSREVQKVTAGFSSSRGSK